MARQSRPGKRRTFALAATVAVLGMAAGAIALKIHNSRDMPVAVIQVAGGQKSAAAPAANPVDWPVRLKIPTIGVDAALEYVRLTQEGALAAPGSPNTAGWYDKGPRPGEQGNAIIDGHFGWKGNIPAVFDNLHKLQKGDAITVVDEKGKNLQFVVRTIGTYTDTQTDPTIFKASDKGIHLNLITCSGTWNNAKASYSNRLIVFADKQ
jgi:LPXTG-site transpeptidase (sortase) family protein